MMIHLLRHGTTTANEQRLYYGSTDLPLSERGVVELKRLRETLPLPTADAYLASGMRRARETLWLLFDETPRRTMEELNEFDYGDFEMKRYDELKNNPAYRRWIDGNDDTPCPNGESHRQFKKRISKGFETIRTMDVESVVVVCHGGVIATLMKMLFPGRMRHFYEWVPDCGRGFAVEIANGSFSYTTI